MEQILKSIGSGYIVIMSLIGFISMGLDKYKARKNAWRIPERTLLLIAFLGGGMGSFLGMHLFRHKTRHGKFLSLLPLSAVLYLLFVLWLSDIL